MSADPWVPIGLMAASISDSAVTAVGGLAVALVGVVQLVINHRATREMRFERRKDRRSSQAAETLADAQRDRDGWRDRYYDCRDQKTRIEARLERVLESYSLPTNAGRSGEYPPLPATLAPRPPEPPREQ